MSESTNGRYDLFEQFDKILNQHLVDDQYWVKVHQVASLQTRGCRQKYKKKKKKKKQRFQHPVQLRRQCHLLLVLGKQKKQLLNQR